MNTPPNVRLEEIFAEAVALSGAKRAAYLDAVCGDQPRLRAEVEELLRSHETADFMPNPAVPEGIHIEEQFARLKPEQAGDRIGNYKLLEQIGEGSFGMVWVAEQERPVRRRVALKIIKLGMDTKEVIARFEQERQALAMMDHPNIAKVFDAGATPFGRPFFVMELVRGIKITDYCDQANLSTSGRLELFIAVCHAVQHAHQKGIIHRDLKPSNVLVTLSDGVPVPKIIDFGVAKATQQRLSDLTIYTQFEQMIGTPLYMSPEQAGMSALDIDTRSDIYSLGVLLYELLTGCTPYDAEELVKLGMDEVRRAIREKEPMRPSTAIQSMLGSAREIAAAHRQADPSKLHNLLRGDLDWIVMKALEKDRTRRYETVNGFAMDIRRHLEDEPVLACAPSFRYRTGKLIRKHIRVVAATAAIMISLLIGLSAAAILYRREQAERRAANEHRLLAERRLEEVASVQLLLGRSLKRQNPLEAFRWLSTAAISGSPLAASELDSMLLDGTRYSESAKVVAVLQAAADSGSAPAAAYLGECYLLGRGLEKDVDRGIKLIRRASDEGFLRAMTVLGTCYQNGVGSPKDIDAAIRCYSQASERGDHEATGKLAEIYLDTTGARMNLREGIDLLRKGALARNGFCMFQYARCYEKGVGVQKDAATAADFYEKAAKAGIEQARDWVFAQQGAVTWLGLTILDPTPQQMLDYGFKKDKVAPVVVQVRSNASLYTNPVYLGGLEGCAFWIVEHPALGATFLPRGNHRSYHPKNTRELAEAILASVATPAEYKQLWRDYAEQFSDKPATREEILKRADAIPPGEPGEYMCRFVYNYPMQGGTLTTSIRLKESDLKELRAFLAK